MTRVGFAGMTHLGIVSMAAAAARGFATIGYDADPDLIARLQRGAPPIAEPDLDEVLAAHRDRLAYAAALADLAQCDLVYISADVPTDDAGQSDLSGIIALIEEVSSTLREDAILVVLSQVPPGFSRRIQNVPANRLYYQVETLVFGRAVERALKPERFIVGCADPGQPLPGRLRDFLDAFDCPILAMRYESAELAKISINCCLAASVTVANTLAELSTAIGADWSEVAPALRLDRRIGEYAYLTPGLGIAGGNLERDLRTVQKLAALDDVDAGLIGAMLSNSEHCRDWCWRVLNRHVLVRRPAARLAVLGLAYKENTHSTKNSPALALLARLEGREVAVHDPVVPANIVPFARAATDPLDCASGADALLLMTPWPLYRDLAVADLARVMRGRSLIDPFRLLSAAAARAAGFAYHALGMPAVLPEPGGP